MIVPNSWGSRLREFNANHEPAGSPKGGQFAPAKVTDSPAFKAWFKDSKVVDAQGNPARVYHGTPRPDRVGDVFDPRRATSGPMAFFTDDPEIASNYAKNKQDTSLEQPDNYAPWFKYAAADGRQLDIDQAWHALSFEERQRIANTLPHVSNFDAEGNEMGNGEYWVDPKGYGLAGKDHWDYVIRQEARGNVLKAAVEVWLSSGALFDREEEFMTILKLGGVDARRLTYDDPQRSNSFVYPVFLSIQNPLDTANIPPKVYAELEDLENRRRRVSRFGADQWDKNTTSNEDWVQRLRDDRKEGTTHAWTSIPDSVTDVLKKHGYDGIRDTGGKYGGDKHTVWVPFTSTQVKSAIGNRKFSARKRSIVEGSR